LSTCCLLLKQVLTKRGYQYIQYHLDPTQFQIPNQRPRYYLISCRNLNLNTNNKLNNYDNHIIYTDLDINQINNTKLSLNLFPLSNYIDITMSKDLEVNCSNIIFYVIVYYIVY